MFLYFDITTDITPSPLMTKIMIVLSLMEPASNFAPMSTLFGTFLCSRGVTPNFTLCREH